MHLLLTFGRLDASRRRLLVEAGALLVVVSVGLRLVPYTRLHKALGALASRTQRSRRSSPAGPNRLRSRSELRRVSPRPKATAEGPADDHADVAWAISAAGRRLPVTITCLIEALASDTMLRRRRHESQLRFGVRRDRGDAPLAAHAWVECDGELVVGVTDDLGDYATLEAGRG